MRHSIVAGLLYFLTGSGAAFAADLPAAPSPQAPLAYVQLAAPVYNWGGLYFGINGGYALANSDWQAAAGFADTGNFKINGGFGGGTVGANFQYGRFVFGVEADADGTDINGSVACGLGTCETVNKWLVTIRGRAGFAIDRVLVYGTAGGAGGDVKATLLGVGVGDNTEVGWTAGAGLEFALTDILTAKIEYLFVDLPNGACSAACGTNIPVNFDANLIRGGLNIKLPF